MNANLENMYGELNQGEQDAKDMHGQHKDTVS